LAWTTNIAVRQRSITPVPRTASTSSISVAAVMTLMALDHTRTFFTKAMRRQGVRHPVVVDEGFTIWQNFAVRAWPTLVLVRPDGSIAGIASGEPSLEGLEEAVEELLEEARREGTLAEKPYRVERAEDIGAARR